MGLTKPSFLTEHHQIDAFCSGEDQIDTWLKKYALRNHVNGASRVYTVCDKDVVVGYYALAAGSISHVAATGNFRRNTPETIPVILLGCLAVDVSYQGQGLGRALFCDSISKVIAASDIIGARGIVVHAISEEAKDFYFKLGLSVSPREERTFMQTLLDLRRNFGVCW
ncbi:MAG: GNAT family N-acetyltransferase [Magnetococcales bacterium]|nr:GNAT family N-acetyltransferase [Magnetococcales bacterium]